MCGGGKLCKKIPNQCKICLQTVKPKYGLQCQGACESWVHYSCLNYTPGKIRDIQTGVINVTCPCPDCKTSVPKEIRIDEPYSCNNVKCPANKAPACESATCQANEITNSRPPPYHPGQLLNCGTDCRSFMIPNTYPTEPSDPCMEGFTVHTNGPTRPPAASGISPGMPSMSTVEQMRQTVGELTTQINELMAKMKTATALADAAGGMAGEQGAIQPCTQKGPKSLCPKPCYCPGNPGTRR